MTFTFDLINSPWVPCILPSGGIRELGLRNALAQAHDLREVHGESPLVTAALYRLLLAVLHRVFGPADYDKWGALWEAGGWDTGRLDAYLEKWRSRFDLFATERPFYQAADARVKPKSVINLVHEVASGNNATLFDHHTEEGGMALTPAAAARAVVTTQSFGLAGLSGLDQKFTDGTCARGVLFLAQGKTLFETLALNLLRYPGDDAALPCRGDDCPAWEMTDPYAPERSLPRGYLDYLTWQSRRILLLPEASANSVVVRQMTTAPALRLDSTVLDPMKHYVKRDEELAMLRFSEERALWRDSAALFRLRSEGWRPPLVFDHLGSLIEEGYLERSQTLRYLALGMANDQGRVFFFRSERMPLPLAYLRNRGLVDALNSGEMLAENVARQLWGAVRTLATYVLSPGYDGDEKHRPVREDLDALTDSWAVERGYWPRLELPFLRLVQDLTADEVEPLEEWAQTLQRTAWTTFEQIAGNLEMSTRALRATVQAREQLAMGLGKVCP